MSKAEEDFRGSGVAVPAHRPLGTLAELSLASGGAAHARHRPGVLGSSTPNRHRVQMFPFSWGFVKLVL